MDGGRSQANDRPGREAHSDLGNLGVDAHKADREPGGRWGESGHDTRAADMKGGKVQVGRRRQQVRHLTFKAGFISFVILAMLAGVAPLSAAAASPKAAGGLGAAAGFAVLADTALTCTNSTVTGPVGVASSGTAVTQTGCALNVQVAPGAYADIVAIRGNPANDVTTLKNVLFVMKAGKVFKLP